MCVSCATNQDFTVCASLAELIVREHSNDVEPVLPEHCRMRSKLPSGHLRPPHLIGQRERQICPMSGSDPFFSQIGSRSAKQLGVGPAAKP